MARLSHEQIAGEIAAQGYSLVDDSDYKSLNSFIKIKCPKGHLIETTLGNFRHVSFCCPICDKNIDFINPKSVPEKESTVQRIIAFDQATEKFGLSIFDDGKLVFHALYVFSGDLVSRLVKIKKFIDEIVIQCWKPDFIIMEDIQYQQNGLMTFKVLAMLLGIIQELCREHEIEFDAVAPNVWRKYAGTAGKTRREEKMLSVAVVKEKYGIQVTDDVAEAILIGRYGSLMHKKEVTWAFGK